MTYFPYLRLSFPFFLTPFTSNWPAAAAAASTALSTSTISALDVWRRSSTLDSKLE